MYINNHLQSGISLTDLFCGAGGSSWGAQKAGAEVVMASNHWPRAIETHSLNFPKTDHDLVDIRNARVQRYPRTTILIASPECRAHTGASGRKRTDQPQMSLSLDGYEEDEVDESAERSRASMEEVVKFAEYHKYEFVIIENVAEIRRWWKFDAWLKKMIDLGYDYQFVYLNSMFAHVELPVVATPDSYAPQSRDRLYIVFWKKGNRRPDLNLRPLAYCLYCDRRVDGVQSFKKTSKSLSCMMYRKQYVYRCPHCAKEVTPFFFAAANAIDWSDPGTKVKDRLKKPLEPRTKERIGIGGRRFANQPLVIPMAYTHGHNNRAVPVTAPMTSQTATNNVGVAMPFIIDHMGEYRVRSIGGPISSLTAQGNHQSVVMPSPFIVNNQAENAPTGIDQPLNTLLTGDHKYLVTSPFLTVQYSPGYNIPVDGALGAITTQDHHGLVVPPSFVVEMYNTSDVRGMDEPLSAITAQGNHHYLATPPYLVEMYGQSTVRGIDNALSTMTAGGIHQGLVLPQPFLMSFYSNPVFQRAWQDAMGTMTTLDRHGFVQPGNQPALEPGSPEWIEECYFRMLKSEEIGLGMGFHPEYTVTGNNKERVKQYGNAVTPIAMYTLIKRCIATLA